MAHSGTSPQLQMSSLPTLKASSFNTPFSGEILARLLDLLPEFVRSRRWFRAKARTILKIDIEDALPFTEADSSLLVLRIAYQDGEEGLWINLSSHLG